MLRGLRPPYLPVLSLLSAVLVGETVGQETRAQETRAQDPEEAERPASAESQPASRVVQVAVKARWIHPVSGPVIENGVILLENGKIAAVGKDVAVPAEAEVIDLKDAHVVPGLVDPLSRLFLDRGQTGPESSVADGLDRFDPNAGIALQNGVTTVYVAPEGTGTVVGQGAVVKLSALGKDPGTAESVVIKESAAVDARLTQGPVESSNIARARLAEGLRNAFKAVEGYSKQKEEHKKALAKYTEDRKKWLDAQRRPASGDGSQSQPASRPSGGGRQGGGAGEGGGRGGGRGNLTPEQIEEMRRRRGGQGGGPNPSSGPGGGPSGGPTSGSGPQRGEGGRGGESRPVESQPGEIKKPTWPAPFQPKPDVEALQRVLQGEIPLRVEVHRADEILMALDLAAEFKIKNLQLVCATDAGEIADQISRAGAGVITGGLSGPMARPAHLRNLTPALPSQLCAKGVPVSLGSGGTREAAARIIEAALAAGHGLDPEEALRSITLEPARQLGVQDRVGSLEKGKDGDLVVFSGTPLASDSRVLRVMVEGRTVFADGGAR